MNWKKDDTTSALRYGTELLKKICNTVMRNSLKGQYHNFFIASGFHQKAET